MFGNAFVGNNGGNQTGALNETDMLGYGQECRAPYKNYVVQKGVMHCIMQ